MNRIIPAIIWTLLIGGACFGQSSFQEITPGASTRKDVEKALGQPVRSISATVFEYKPPAGIGKIEVEYQAGSAIADRVEVYFLRPVSRQALIERIGLAEADARKSTEGKLVEYFGGALLLALTYASTDASSGVSHIGYYSRELFASAVGKSPGAQQNSGTQAGASRSGSARLGEMNLPDYMRGPGGSSSATADRAGHASTSGGNSSVGSGETKQRKNTTRRSPSSDDSLSMTVTTRADGLEVQPSTKPGTTGNNNAGSSEEEISLSASELKRFVGTYEFMHSGVKPAEVRLVAGKLRLTMGAVTYTLAPILGDDFVVGDQGESEMFRFRAAEERGVKVYFTILEDKLRNLYVVENQRQPKRFYIAVPKP